MSTLTLLFCHDGTVVLEEDGEPTWASDDDEDFPVSIGTAHQLDIEDATEILVYLVEADILTEAESQLCSIEEEEEEEEPEVIDAHFVDVTATVKPS